MVVDIIVHYGIDLELGSGRTQCWMMIMMMIGGDNAAGSGNYSP